MNVSLTPELEQYINNQVKTGLYNSSSEVVRAAIRLLVKSETSPANPDYENYKMWLNQEIQIGLDQAARGELIPGGEALKNLRNFRKEQLKSHGKI
jgi:antitoxin ParD1/3/4